MSGSIQMPKYKCHKEVWALKIEQVKPESAERVYLHFADKRYAPIEIDKDWIGKHKPSDGGYYVQYQDGYTSYSPAEAFESGYTAVENLEVPDPSKNELSVAFRLAAQISGIKDEVADFMAGLDGALMSGKSIEALHDEIMERIALYDTPEAMDLFMNLVQTRAASLPDTLTPAAMELLKDLPFPHRRVVMVFDAPNLGDGYMVPEVVQAFNEAHRRGDWGVYPFTAKNGVTINLINLSAGSSPGVIGVEPPLSVVERLADVMLKDITSDKGLLTAFTQEVVRHNAAVAAIGNEKDVTTGPDRNLMDAARHELDGKYISANATVIDACQMPADGSLSGFTEWSDKVGFTEYNKMRLSSEGKTLEVSPGDWVVAYLNAEPGRMVFNSFEPEIFEALYTSAAELLK